MNRKTANIVIGVAILLWIVFCLVVLLVSLFRGGIKLLGWRYIIQILIALFLSIWLELRICKTFHNK